MFKNLNPQLKMGLALGLCVLPMGTIVAFRVFDVAVSNVVIIALAVACPASHLLMMRMGLHDHGAAHVHTDEQDKL